ncbi:MAG: hypothetical protein NTV10_00275 [Methanoregula sp.]|nr:hypothetical protein [Methanoregula sp.]
MTPGKRGWEGRREEEARRKIQKFLQGRRNPETKQYVGKLIEKLEKVRKEDTERKIKEPEVGWVRVKTLLDEFVGEGKLIKNQTTFYRLLDDLFQDLVIDKRVRKMDQERGRQATFYRIPFEYRQEWLATRDGLEDAYAARMLCIHDLIEQLMIAQELLTEMGCGNPHEIIIERFTRQMKKKPSCTAYKEDPNLINEFMDRNGQINYPELLKKILPKKEDSAL